MMEKYCVCPRGAGGQPRLHLHGAPRPRRGQGNNTISGFTQI